MEEKRKYTLNSGALFFNFENDPVFRGTFNGEAYNQETGEVIGFNFTEEKTGTVWILPNSYAIEKALEMKVGDTGSIARELEKSTWELEFLGKVERAGKQPFNRFRVELFV
jgi:hypothetical protein